jgi:hypothetical protein
VFAESLLTRFGGQVTRIEARSRMVDPLHSGAVPHHGFHVFGVYPWVGLLRTGAVDQALYVLNRCRIRWGRVVLVRDGEAVVSTRQLRWDGRCLALGGTQDETVTTARALGLGMPTAHRGAAEGIAVLHHQTTRRSEQRPLPGTRVSPRLSQRLDRISVVVRGRAFSRR